ncbi:type-2 angiotensin II receptor [Nematostella vectensis]|uniref:type-2 angiotensin II receptor n=1 Tax=Nematostella vectensis TaxID=45351 RepID=UPI00207746BC|nr:type-2 angiotensin II receptor [Nematostella vectensis]
MGSLMLEDNSNFSSNPTMATLEACEVLFTDTSTIAKTIAYLLMFLFSLTGNVFVILNVRCTKNYSTSTTSVLIMNMAVSDLLIVVLAMPRELFEIVARTESWRVPGVPGLVLCKTLFFLTDISPLVSVLSLCFIAIERFAIVMYPLTWIVASRRSYHRVAIATSWIVPAIFLWYYFEVFKLVHTGTEAYCGVAWEPTFDPQISLKVFGSLAVSLFYIVPFLLISSLYIGIIRQLRKPPFNTSNYSDAHQHRINISKLAVSVVLAFALCFTPFYVGIFMIITDVRSTLTCRFQIFWLVARTMGYTNTAFNPWIYFLFVSSTAQNRQRTMELIERGRRFISTYSVLMRNPAARRNNRVGAAEERGVDSTV